jgi:hypothetical protein
MTFETGPYLKMACFCERLLREADGVATVVRVIDRLIHTEAKPDASAEMPPVTYEMKLVLMLIPGSAVGRHELKIEREPPSGIREKPIALTVQLEGGNRGANVVMDTKMTFPLEGLYWFNVYFDDVLLTKMPFQVLYQRISIPGVVPGTAP